MSTQNGTRSEERAIALQRLRLKRLGLVPEVAEPDAVDLVKWIEEEFYIQELRGPIKLHPYQRACLIEALRRDPLTGKFIYDIVVWSDIKKSAKSVIAAAVMLARAFHHDYGFFRVVGNDQKQAMSRVFGFMETALRLNRRIGARASINRLLISLDTGSKIEAVAVDPKGEAGGADDMVEFTELHAASNKASMAMWTEVTISPLKHGYAQRWIDTYAGWSGESPLLEQLYQAGVKEGHRLSLPDSGSDDLEVYANGSQFTLWNTHRGMLPWQTEAYYAEEERSLRRNEFDRVHGNQWVTSEQEFVPIAWWDACQSEIPPINEYRSIVVALDAAVDDDCFAIVALSYDRELGLTYVRYVRAWRPVDNQPILYSNALDVEDREYPEGELRWLCANFNVVSVTYDPYQLHAFCSALAVKGLAAFEKFDQGAPRLKADKGLYDDIREHRIIHDGDLTLREHISNANSTAEDKDTMRIIKRAQHLKIDLAVATSMANDRARFWLA